MGSRGTRPGYIDENPCREVVGAKYWYDSPLAERSNGVAFHIATQHFKEMATSTVFTQRIRADVSSSSMLFFLLPRLFRFFCVSAAFATLLVLSWMTPSF